MFKRTLALALLVSSAAHAADLIETPPFASETADWSGLQLSVFGGAIHSDGRSELGETAGALIALDVRNGLFPRSIENDDFHVSGGVGIGYDQQFGNWIAGFAVDGAITPLQAESRFSRVDPNPDPIFNGVVTNTTYQTEVEWLATARLRLGYVLNDSLMVYGTGGLAAGDVTNRFVLSLPNLPALAGGPYTSPPRWQQSGTETGFVVGFGAEKKITENLRLTFSVEHVDLSNVNVEANDPPVFGPNELNYRFDNNFTTAKVGLSFSF